MMNNGLPHTLKMFRNLKGIEVKQIAAHLDISETAYGKYENGVNNPKLSTIKEIANYLGISFLALLNETPDSIFEYYNAKYYLP